MLTMAWFSVSLQLSSSFIAPKVSFFDFFLPMKCTQRRRPVMRDRRPFTLSVVNEHKSDDNERPTKLITFLGKGGSGKTTAAVFAAQHYSMSGAKTCLVIHGQDPTVEYLLDCKIGPNSTKFNDNLSVIRFETTKMIRDPLKRIKSADASLNLTQSILEGVVGEELGILPGMDSIVSAFELDRLVGFLRDSPQRVNENGKYDIVIYDGISTEETIRMIGACSNARVYLKYMRSLSEKTDLGRVAGPSLLRLVNESLSLSGRDADLNGKMSSEIWDYLEKTLEKGSSVFAEPQRFGCYIVMDPSNTLSVKSAMRYWGCCIQAGASISGAFGTNLPNIPNSEVESVQKKFSPLPYASIPNITFSNNLNWNELILSDDSKDARSIFAERSSNIASVKFDASDKSVILFMPGFDKSEIKLFQFRGKSEILVEAADQRRVIRLPVQIQGKVGGAKFVDQSLIITLR